MVRLASMIVTAALLLSADIPGAVNLRSPVASLSQFPASENLPALPDMSSAADPVQAPQAGATKDTPKKTKEEPLQPESLLALVRFVDGEFARVVLPIPRGKNGFHLKAGAPVDENALRQMLGGGGAAINPGDTAQITNLAFKDREIVVDINGGGKGKTRFRDRIHLDIGGIPSAQVSDPVQTVKEVTGATLVLEFDRPLPDMTPDELKGYLSGMLDFSKQRSAAVQWVDTLPPDIQNAIKEKRPAVGMDRDMVMAAIGRPDRKVRERLPDGSETEDWIYGKPPAKTIFVKFEGEKVIQVEQFPL